jgi:hypothetical protein
MIIHLMLFREATAIILRTVQMDFEGRMHKFSMLKQVVCIVTAGLLKQIPERNYLG